MAKQLLCKAVTPFKKTGELHEAALRLLLQRCVDAKVGVCLGSADAGEGHALTSEELQRLYQIGVEVCKGKVPVHANPPEQATARATRGQMTLAAAAGVDLVNLYGPAGRHGYVPTDREILAYFDSVLSAIKHPVALTCSPMIGYTPKAGIIAQVCEKYSQVKAVNLCNQNEVYFIDLKNRLKRNIDLYVLFPGSFNALNLGAAGVLSSEANIIPKTLRKYLDIYATNRGSDELNTLYLQINRFTQYVSKWNPSNPRWLKMSLIALKLPGGEGGVREPYQLPPAEEVQKFGAGLLELGIPELDEQAAAIA